MTDALDDAPGVNLDVYPAGVTDRAAWVPWSDWDRKQPNASPYADTDDPYSWSDPANWTSFEHAGRVANTTDVAGIGFVLQQPNDPYDDDPDPFCVADYDDARDPETGRVHPVVREHIQRAGSYADVSYSATGVHLVMIGALPEGVRTIDDDLSAHRDFPDASIEVYDGKRFMAFTGRHIEGTPRDVRDAQGFIDDLADEFVTVAESTPDALTREPEKTRAQLADVETTDDIQDVFDALQHTGPGNVSLRSPVTEERADDSRSLDPTWNPSERGDKLAEFADGWVMRDGMHGLDALQVVALEERIITSEGEYPSGETFWRAVDALRQRGAHIPEYDGSTDGGKEPVSVLPLAQLDALRPDDRRRAARKRGVEWPTTDDLRARLRERVLDAVRDGEDTVIRAPTSLGKSYTVATEQWRSTELADVTDGAPVIHLHETREARDRAADTTDEHGGKGAVLRGRSDACPVARGLYDPDDGDDENENENDTGSRVVTIDGRPASAWFADVCDDRGVPFSAAHAYLDEHNDQRAPLPCCPPADENGARYECEAIRQWQGVPRDDDGNPTNDVVHATHPFAHVPGLVRGSVVVVDEQPDYTVELGQDRIRRAIAAYLQEIDAPVSTFEAFVSLARLGTGAYRTDAGREAAALAKALDSRSPARGWYLTDPDAHTLAPAIARALWYALRDDGEGNDGGPDANDRRAATVPHEPPRLDAGAHDDAGWNREWVTVVIDEENTVRRVRAAPDLSGARCVIGLDAHPTPTLWQRNTRPNIQVEPLCETDEERLWRRYERGLLVVQVGDETRPAGKEGKYAKRDRGREPFIRRLREHYGSAFATAITDSHSENQLTDLMLDAGVTPDRLETMHFGEERSRNDFAGESVGAVLGCIDAGDDYVLDTLAECGLDARPELDTDDDGEEFRAYGREFVGPDADTAGALVASVRETHVAQAAGRYARDPDNPENRAIVFVRTDAMPPGFADYQVTGVEHVAGEKQRAVAEALREHPGATARELREHAADRLDDGEGVTKRHVAKTLVAFLERGVARRRTRAGSHGGDEWRADGLSDADVSGDVSLSPEAIANSPSWGTREYQFVVSSLDAPPREEPTRSGWGSLSSGLVDGGDSTLHDTG